MAVLAVAAVGAGVGASIGGTFLGLSAAAWGWTIGSVVGNYLFAPKSNTEGPRLTGVRYSVSTYGATIPIVLGAWRVGTNIIWMGELEEVANRQKVGKRAYQTTYSYRQSFAAALCQGPIAGVKRIWFDSELVYSNDGTDIISTIVTGKLEEQMTLYLGTEAQDPDAVIEAELGAGEVPAYRGVAYVVFERLDLTPWGNRIPSITAEVIESGAYATPTKISELGTFSGGVAVDGSTVQVATWADATQVTIKTIEATTGTVVASEVFANSWPPLQSSGPVAYCANDPRLACWDMNDPDPDPGEEDDASRWIIATTSVDENGVTFTSLEKVDFAQDWTYAAIDQFCVLDGYVYCIGKGSSPGEPGLYKYRYYETVPTVEVVPTAVFMLSGIESVSASGSACVATDGTHIYMRWSGLSTKYGWTFKFDADLNLVESIDTDDWNSGDVSFTVHDGHLLVVNYRFEGQYHLAQLRMNGDGTVTEVGDNTTGPDVGNGDVVFLWPAGGGVVFSNSAEWSMVPVLSNAGRTLAQAVTAITSDVLSGAEIDVTDITGITLHGTALERRSSRRSWLESLCAAYAVDGVESNGKIAFRRRGSAEADTIEYAHLGAMRDGGDDSTPASTTEREQQLVLPHRIDVSYADISASYEIGTQPAVRGQVLSDQAVSVDLPIAMTSAAAAQTAYRMLYEAHAARTRRDFVTDMRYAHLEPTDAVLLEEASGALSRVRLISKSEDDGILTWTAVADDDGTQVQVVDGASLPSPGTVTPPAGSTRMVMFESPPLSDDEGSTLGAYVVASPFAGTWPGGSVWSNTPGDTNYTYAGDLTELGIVGQVLVPPADVEDDGPLIDPGAVEVTAFSQAPTSASSVTDWLTAGTNLALLGRELVQFRTVTDLGDGEYRLTGLLRKCHGTPGTGHAVGEKFALIDPVRDAHLISLPTSYVGASRVYRAVTAGQSVPDAQGLTYSLLGGILKPISPVHINITRASNGDRVIRWTRRTRVYQTWLEGADVPLGESSEAYLVTIINADTGATLRTLTATTGSVTYTLAQWEADFGVDPASVTVRVEQLSSVIGYGAAGEATLTWPSEYNNEFTRDWDDGVTTGQTLFYNAGGGGTTHSVTSSQYRMVNSSNAYDAKSRFDNSPSFADGFVEVDVAVPTDGYSGILTRTTYWRNANQGFGWCVYLDSAGKIYYGYGNNANSAGFTQVGATASAVHTPGETIRLGFKQTGTSHKVYSNGVLRLSATDSNQNVSGQVGLFVGPYVSIGHTAVFDNFRARY